MLDWIQNVSEIIIGIKHPKSHYCQCKTAAITVFLEYFASIFMNNEYWAQFYEFVLPPSGLR